MPDDAFDCRDKNKFIHLKVVLTTLVAYASAQAVYPAGVDPQKCPNFPICDNAALHNQAPAHNNWNAQPYQAQPQWNQQPAAPQWQPAPQWNAPAPQQWNAPAPWKAAPAPQWNAIPAAPAGGDKYPAGVNPQSCPNYPYCDTNNPGHAGGHHAARVAPLPGYTERLYPAGVSAAQCPNYPEC